MEALQNAVSAGDLSAVMDAGIKAKAHVRAMAETTADIRIQVVPDDGLGEVIESLSELVLRAIRAIVLAELPTLHAVLSEPTVCARSCPPLPEPCRTVDDLLSSLRDDVDRSTRAWQVFRSCPGVERAAYRAALRATHASVRELATTSMLARFLREGARCTDWPALQEVCERILAALTIRIDIDPDLPILMHAPTSPDMTPGRAP
jgi:hypothetical protein